MTELSTTTDEEFLIDVLEGGLGLARTYWLEIVDVPKEHVVEIIDQETGRQHAITLDVVARGLDVLAAGRANYANPGYSETTNRLAAFVSSRGADSDTDALDYDAAIQAGVFGEVIYG
jgi:hypothetical protein